MKSVLNIFLSEVILVAPARERGLKLLRLPIVKHRLRRSREGAWIEMLYDMKYAICLSGRSREGAWIEMCTQRIAQSLALVAPARERGLKLRIFLN